MPTYDFRCTKCDKVTEEFLNISKLENFMKEAKCEGCKGGLVRDFGGQTMNFSMKTFKESSRRDDKFDKKVQELNQEANINKDPYFDMR